MSRVSGVKIRLRVCSILLVSLGCAAGAFGCTPVKHYRVDSQEPTKTDDAPDAQVDASEPENSAPADGDMKAQTGSAAGASGDTGEEAGAESEAAPAADADKVDAGAPTDPEPDIDTMQSGDPPEQRPVSPAHQQAGWSALMSWASLPTFSSTTTQLFSTHERGEGTSYPLVDPGNKDFNSFLAQCGEHPELVGQQVDGSVECGPGQRGYMIAADDGPGYVSRILLGRGISSPSSSVLVDLRPVNERIRIYIDDQAAPVFDGLWSEWADAGAAPYDGPLTGWTSGATVSYLPISYSSRLRVFVDDLMRSSSLTLYYLQVTTHRVTATEPFDAEELNAARAEVDQLLAAPRDLGASWFDQDVTLEGAGAWTVWTHEQPGTLQAIEVQLEAAAAKEILNETSLRLSWDEGAAAVDLPLGAMFGARHGVKPVSTLPLSVKVEGSLATLSLTLPMPFARSAKLELLHAGTSSRTLKLRVHGSDALPSGEWGRLRSVFSERRDPRNGERFAVASMSGRGKYLGTIFYAHGKVDNSREVRASELGFMEGDERLEIDGEVVWLGTGTDNYFNGGFFFKDGLFNSPFAAVSQLDADESAGMSEATMMRWNILGDEINFQRQLDLSLEFGANRPACVRDYAAVSFYYQ